MNIGFHNFYTIYHGNKMFQDPNSPIGDELMYPFIYLKKYFESKGHQVCTIDMAPLHTYDAVIFLEYPGKSNRYFRELQSKYPNIPLYLVLVEPETIRPANWKRGNHKGFKKIFSWNTTLADGSKYIWLNWPTRIIPNGQEIQEKAKFCTLISSNKFSNIKNELYSERRKAIEWFERYDPENFDLYGVGWDRIYLRMFGRANFVLDKIYRSTRWYLKIQKYRSYRGHIKNKRDILRQYKFAICYENAIADGFVTEKIFDCMLADVVPIYLGAPDIERLIPSDLYIDKRNFASYQDLSNHLKGMDDSTYNEYISNIRRFLSTDKVFPWTPECYAQVLEKEIVN